MREEGSRSREISSFPTRFAKPPHNPKFAPWILTNAARTPSNAYQQISLLLVFSLVSALAVVSFFIKRIVEESKCYSSSRTVIIEHRYQVFRREDQQSQLRKGHRLRKQPKFVIQSKAFAGHRPQLCPTR